MGLKLDTSPFLRGSVRHTTRMKSLNKAFDLRWANEKDRTHLHSHAWMDEGWKVDSQSQTKMGALSE